MEVQTPTSVVRHSSVTPEDPSTCPRRRAPVSPPPGSFTTSTPPPSNSFFSWAGGLCMSAIHWIASWFYSTEVESNDTHVPFIQEVFARKGLEESWIDLNLAIFEVPQRFTQVNKQSAYVHLKAFISQFPNEAPEGVEEILGKIRTSSENEYRALTQMMRDNFLQRDPRFKQIKDKTLPQENRALIAYQLLVSKEVASFDGQPEREEVHQYIHDAIEMDKYELASCVGELSISKLIEMGGINV